MKYEKEFEEFLESNLFNSRIKVVMELIEQRFEDSFLFNLSDVIEKTQASFSSVIDIELSGIYSKEAILKLIEKNKVVEIKKSLINKTIFKIKDKYVLYSRLNLILGEKIEAKENCFKKNLIEENTDDIVFNHDCSSALFKIVGLFEEHDFFENDIFFN